MSRVVEFGQQCCRCLKKYTQEQYEALPEIILVEGQRPVPRCDNGNCDSHEFQPWDDSNE
jgi:hypothetical protein